MRDGCETGARQVRDGCEAGTRRVRGGYEEGTRWVRDGYEAGTRWWTGYKARYILMGSATSASLQQLFISQSVGR